MTLLELSKDRQMRFAITGCGVSKRDERVGNPLKGGNYHGAHLAWLVALRIVYDTDYVLNEFRGSDGRAAEFEDLHEITSTHRDMEEASIRGTGEE
jgi:hypothetical protein